VKRSAPVQEIPVKRWSDFEEVLRWLDRWRAVLVAAGKRGLYEPRFRGLGNGEWGLENTLERSYPAERSDQTLNLVSYYQKVSASKPAIETLTGKRWGAIPRVDQFKRRLEENKSQWLDMFLGSRPSVYEYLIYLRHHGFPSPLLDWTASPYVAAFFALDIIAKDAKNVCIYALLQDLIYGGGSDAHMFFVGRYVQSHPRHFLQQCDYSMCVELKRGDYLFLPHEEGVAGALGPGGKLFKYVIPATERRTALEHLDQMNINEYSLFGSEDALIRTIARRECLFRGWRV